MEFQIISGNAGTGMCQRGAYEHGCEFAPVDGVDKIDIEILSALFKHHAVSNFDERCSASVTALQVSFFIKFSLLAIAYNLSIGKRAAEGKCILSGNKMTFVIS